MKKMGLVFKNELITLLSRPSFWLGFFGLPVAGVIVFTVVGAIQRNANASQAISNLVGGMQEYRTEGYVDQSGIIHQIPGNIPEATFIPFPDEQTARNALQAGTIPAFFLVPADYLQSGRIIYVRSDFNPLAAQGAQAQLFNQVIRGNLVGGNALLADLIEGPLKVDDHPIGGGTNVQTSSPGTFFVPYAITLLLYILILTSSSLLLNSISKEKENRIMEILITSVTPIQLLSGKIMALGIIGLLQTLFWLGTSYLLLNLSGSTFSMTTNIYLPPSFLLWGLVFFLLGYAVYASLLAGLGALAANLREASQATFMLTLPMFVPLLLSNTLFAQAPNGAAAIALSIFPLSAPVAMMARLSAGGVPGWHPWMAAFLLLLTAVFIVRLVARMFRAQSLLSGKPFSLKGYFSVLAGRE
jgi:ABC-2 type transport system permease protein